MILPFIIQPCTAHLNFNQPILCLLQPLCLPLTSLVCKTRLWKEFEGGMRLYNTSLGLPLRPDPVSTFHNLASHARLPPHYLNFLCAVWNVFLFGVIWKQGSLHSDVQSLYSLFIYILSIMSSLSIFFFFLPYPWPRLFTASPFLPRLSALIFPIPSHPFIPRFISFPFHLLPRFHYLLPSFRPSPSSFALSSYLRLYLSSSIPPFPNFIPTFLLSFPLLRTKAPSYLPLLAPACRSQFIFLKLIYCPLIPHRHCSSLSSPPSLPCIS